MRCSSGHGSLFFAVWSNANTAPGFEEILQIVFADSDRTVPKPVSDEKPTMDELANRIVVQP